MIENKGWMQWEVPFYGRWLEQRWKRMPILQRFGGTACQGERTNGSCKSVWHEWGVEEEKTFLYHARVFWASLVMKLTKETKKKKSNLISHIQEPQRYIAQRSGQSRQLLYLTDKENLRKFDKIEGVLLGAEDYWSNEAYLFAQLSWPWIPYLTFPMSPILLV